MKRKRKSNPEFPDILTVRVDKLMHSELDQIATAEDRDISYLIRKAIEKFIEDYKPPKK